MRRIIVLLFILALILSACNCPPCPATPTPPPPPTVQPGLACWDPRLDQAGVTLERRDGSYELIAAWVTINGSWDDVIPCAKKWQKDTLGGDHNAFGRAETPAGSAVNETFALVWPDGGDTRTPEPDGWANIPLYGGGGRYTLFVFGGDKLNGLTLPGNHHWSFFGVWRQKATLAEADAARVQQWISGQSAEMP